MSLQESRSAPLAIPSTPGTGIELVPEPGANPGSGTGDWFYDCAIAVFGKEAGQQLHLATDWPRTSCYAFVARDPGQRRKLHPDFLRILFHSEHGAPFHDAFMHGSTARWWVERKLAADVGTAAISEFSSRRAVP